MTREEAVTVLKAFMDNPLFSDAHKQAFNIAIKALEIEPTTKNDLGVDAVSREKAIKWAEFYTEIYDAEVANKEIMKMLRDLPSVTPQEPKKGHWILTDVEENRIWFCNCSECGKDPQDYISGTENWWLTKSNIPNYCPNCGSDNREVEK